MYATTSTSYVYSSSQLSSVKQQLGTLSSF